jgi:hypothetical protein
MIDLPERSLILHEAGALLTPSNSILTSVIVYPIETNCIVLYCIYFGPRNPEDIGQVNVQQYKPQNN